MKIDPEIEKYILPFGLLASGIIIGFIIEKIFLLQIRKLAIKARWEGGRVIINALRNITFLWFVIGGIYGCILNLDIIGPKLFSHLKMGLAIILILSVTILVSKLATGFVKLYTGRVLPSTSIFVNLTKVFVFILGMLVLLQTVGISVAPILTALGVGGLAVALALQDTLSNLFAGLHIIASKKVRTGDYIKLDAGGEGYLEDITWRNTSIRTLSNNTIVVPNAKMASGIITNYNIPSKDIDLNIDLRVGYDVDLDKVETITVQVAKETMDKFVPDINNFKPVVRYGAFAESSINFVVVLRVKQLTDQGLIKHEFLKRIYNKYKEEGIEIPYPKRTIHVYNEERD